jgi:hypothetical protein
MAFLSAAGFSTRGRPLGLPRWTPIATASEDPIAADPWGPRGRRRSQSARQTPFRQTLRAPAVDAERNRLGRSYTCPNAQRNVGSNQMRFGPPNAEDGVNILVVNDRGRKGALLAYTALAMGLLAQRPAFAQDSGVSLPSAVASVPQRQDPRSRYTGPRFVYAGVQGERAAVQAAIERVVSQLFFVIRPIARNRLRDSNPVFPSVEFHFAPGTVETVMPGQPNVRTPDNGTAVMVRGIEGNMIRGKHWFERDGHLVEATWSDDGARRIDFVLSPDGRTLFLRVEVTSRHLPQPIRYQLTYRRCC